MSGGSDGVPARCTVVLPTCNSQRHIVEQVDSILGQTLAPFRVSIRDDCSTDLTLSLLFEHYGHLPQVEIHRNAQNLGQEANLALLLAAVETEYFAIADHDDVWMPNKLKRSIRHLDSGHYDLVYCDLSVVDEYLNIVEFSALKSGGFPIVEGESPVSLFVRNPVHGCTTVARTELLNNVLPFPAGIPHYDRWMAMVAATRGGLGYLDESLVLYRQHEKNSVGAVKAGLGGLMSQVARRGNGDLRAYLCRRLTERSNMAVGMANLFPSDIRMRFLADYFGADRLRRILLSVGYIKLARAERTEVRLFQILTDVSLTTLAPRPADSANLLMGEQNDTK